MLPLCIELPPSDSDDATQNQNTYMGLQDWRNKGQGNSVVVH